MAYAERDDPIPGAIRWRSDSGGGLVLPDGCMDLILLGDRVVVAGPDTRAHRTDADLGPAVGLRLPPGYLPLVLPVPADEVPDPQNLKMWLTVNGETMQNGSTKTMVYGVAFLVSYLSQFMSLQPGDVISTGTPPGVGLGMKPPVFLKEGDVMELGIDKLGSQKQTVYRTKI